MTMMALTTSNDSDDDFQDLKNFILLDEDLSSGDRNVTAPWMRITASVPASKIVRVEYVYYQTSQHRDVDRWLSKWMTTTAQ